MNIKKHIIHFYQKKHYLWLILLLILFISGRILQDSYLFSEKMMEKEKVPYIYANNTPLKVFPEIEKNDNSLDSSAYDFINKKEWKVKSKLEKKKKEIVVIKRTKSIKARKKPVIKKQNKVKIVTISKKERQLTQRKYKNMVQLGAFYSFEGAEKEWYKIQKTSSDALTLYDFHIEKAYLSHNHIIFRLKIGPFKTKDNARYFCRKLRKKNIDCFFSLS